MTAQLRRKLAAADRAMVKVNDYVEALRDADAVSSDEFDTEFMHALELVTFRLLRVAEEAEA